MEYEGRTHPAGHNLAIDKHFEEVCSVRRMGAIDRVLKPNLSARIYRYITSSNSTEDIESLHCIVFGKSLRIDVRDSIDVDASKSNHIA